MATKEQIETIMVLLEDSHPAEFLKKMDASSAGIGAVLRLLYEAEHAVTAGQISQFMGVSTARVAVLLKKMVARGYIIKESGATDARTTVVTLSDFGRETAQKMRNDMYHQVGTVIDQLGMERLIEFTTISKEISSIVSGPSIDIID